MFLTNALIGASRLGKCLLVGHGVHLACYPLCIAVQCFHPGGIRCRG